MKKNNLKKMDNGWEYISSIFKMMIIDEPYKEIFEPHFIYRGITKRYFSQSPEIEAYLKDNEHIDIEKLEEDRKIKELNKCYIEKIYPYMKLQWMLIDKDNYTNEKTTELENKLDKFLKEKLKNWKSDLENWKSNLKDDAPYEKLEKIREETLYKKLIPEFIESGLAVRLLEKQKNENYTSANKHIDYVNYIIHMINDLKTRFPKYEDENYTDLEILADIQHKGAASCLVDFSDNFLTSLWFATQSDNEDFGYLFCYDINNEILVNDKLTILDPQRYDEKSITELLYETTKTTTYSGKREYKFWLWKPSNVNERIARQDSVFIFGLEKFKISDHAIKVIPIPPSWKKPIQHTLKTYFGVTGESIYCDVDGYADSNSKNTPYEKIVNRYFQLSEEQRMSDSDSIENKDNIILGIDNLEHGMSCLFQCEYELALQYFILYEKNFEFSFDSPVNEKDKFIENSRIFYELHYSKAVCLKHMGDSFGAIYEYNKIIEFDKIFKDKYFSIEYFKDNYFRKKYQKIINDLLDIYYDKKLYDEIIENLNKLEKRIESKDKNNFNALKITIKNEIVLLKKFEDIENNSTIFDYKDIKESQPLFYLLNVYFEEIFNYLKGDTLDNDILDDQIKELKKVLKKKIKKESEKESEKDQLNDICYYSWQLKDIKRAINRYKVKDKVVNMKKVTSIIEDVVTYCKGLAPVDPY